jgi:succinate-acetate transporter protein
LEGGEKGSGTFTGIHPALDRQHQHGLFLYAFGAFTVYMLAASFRTNVVTVTALMVLSLTLFLLAAGNYGATAGLVRAAG